MSNGFKDLESSLYDEITIGDLIHISQKYEVPQAVCLEDGMLGYFASSVLVEITVLEANEV